MELKKKIVLFRTLGVALPETYAQIEILHIGLDGKMTSPKRGDSNALV